jgi:CPA2 family monovalent cation:H+ antiporter-2
LKNGNYIATTELNRRTDRKSISESHREKSEWYGRGIERNGKRLLNPESDLILQKNDILWVVG